MKWFHLIFLVTGLGLLCGSLYTGLDTWKFIQEGKIASGTVLRNDSHTSTSRDSKGYSTTTTYYNPVVSFKAEDGKAVVFTSSLGTGNSPAYDVGEIVEVLYMPEDPEKSATINTFIELWFGPCIMAFMSVVFLVVGKLARSAFSPAVVAQATDIVRAALLARHEKTGAKPGRTITGVKIVNSDAPPFLDETISASVTTIEQEGRSDNPAAPPPWFIHAEWTDPKTGKTHRFKSKAIPRDPRGMVGMTIPVRIQPDDPGTYEVDIAKLVR